MEYSDDRRLISHRRLPGTVSKREVGHLAYSITASPSPRGQWGEASGMCVCVFACMGTCMGVGCAMMEKGKIDGLSLMGGLLAQA